MDAQTFAEPVAGDDAADGALLAAAREVAARRMAIWQRRRLSLRLTILLWALRVYVFLMLAVVAIQLARIA